MTREHAYTALSRGRRGNELFLVADDPRVEERHASEVDFDPLDAVRRAIGRTAGKRMAVDEVQQVVAPFEQLCRERDEIFGRIGEGPDDPSWDYRRLSEALAREKHGRDGAQWRLDKAQDSLHDLGPIGRRTHRTERRELERRIAGFERDITRHDERAADLEVQLSDLTPGMLERSRWEREHSADLERMHTLDRQIDLNQRLESVATRQLDGTAARGGDI